MSICNRSGIRLASTARPCIIISSWPIRQPIMAFALTLVTSGSKTKSQSRSVKAHINRAVPWHFCVDDSSVRVPGEIKRSRDLRGGRWSWTLKLTQKRSRAGRWSWAEKVRLPLLELSKLFVNSNATDTIFLTLPKHSS